MSAHYDLHNELVAEILPRIVKPILAAGGGPGEVLVVIESLLVGIVLFAGNGVANPALVQAVADGAKARLAGGYLAAYRRILLH